MKILRTLIGVSALVLPSAKAQALDFWQALDTIVERDFNLKSQDALNRSEVEALLADRRSNPRSMVGSGPHNRATHGRDRRMLGPCPRHPRSPRSSRSTT